MRYRREKTLYLAILLVAAALLAYTAYSQAPPPLPATIQGEVSIYCVTSSSFRQAPAGVPIYAYSSDGILLDETVTGQDSSSSSGYFLVIEDYEGVVKLYVGDVYAGSIEVRSGNLYTLDLSVRDEMPPSKPDNLEVTPKYSSTPTIVWSASSDNIYVEYYEVTVETIEGTRVGSWKVTDTSFQLPLQLPDGEYIARIKPVDAACQAGEEARASFIVDTTPPEVASVYPEPDSIVPGPDVEFEFRVRDVTPQLIVQLYIDDVLVAPDILKVREGWVIRYTTQLEDGQHSVYMILRDDAGYTTTLEYSFTSDSTFPRIEVVEAPPEWVNSTNVSFQFKVYDPNGGSVTVAVFLDGEEVEFQWISDKLISVDLSGLAEGNHVLEVIAVDDAGLESKLEYNFGVDLAPPSIEIVAPEITNAENVCIEAVASDELSGVDWSTAVFTVNGEQLQPDYVQEDRAGVCIEPPEGIIQYSFTVADLAGNTGSEEGSILVDRTPPVLETPGSLVTSNTGGVEVVIGASDSLAGVALLEAYLEDELVLQASYDGESSVTEKLEINPPEGVYTVQVKARDIAGNEAVEEFTLVIDQTPPTITILEPQPEAILPGPKVTIKIKVQDETSWVDEENILLLLNGNSLDHVFDPETGIIEAVVSLEPGSYTIQARVADIAGNTVEETWSFTVDPETARIDFNPPTGSIIKGTVLSVTISISDEGGLDTVKILVDDEVVEVCDCRGETLWEYALELELSEGTHTVEIEVTESSGRVTTARAVYTLDATPPSIVFSGEEPVVSGRSLVDLSLIVEDNVGIARDSVEIIVNGEPVEASYTWSEANLLIVSLTLDEGAHQIDITVTDLAGNASSMTINVIVDLSPPILASSIPGEGEVVDSTNGVTINMVIIENLTWIESINVYINGEEVKTDVQQTDGDGNSLEYTIVVELEDVAGKTHVRIEAVDAAGNTLRAEYTFYADAYPPLLLLETELQEVNGMLVYNGDKLNMSFKVSDVDTWIEEVIVKVNGIITDYLLEDETLTVNLEGEGTYTVDVEVIDASGKTARLKHTVVLDATPPQITSSNASNEVFILVDRDAIKVVVWDASGVEPSIRVETEGPLTVTHDITKGEKPGELIINIEMSSLDSGLGEIRVIAEDIAGRISVYRQPVLVDLEEPQLQAPPLITELESNIAVEISLSDDTLQYHNITKYDVSVSKGKVELIDHVTGKIIVSVPAGIKPEKVTVEYVDPAGRKAFIEFYVVKSPPLEIELKLEEGLNLVGIPAGTVLSAINENLKECEASIVGLIEPGSKAWSMEDPINEIIEWTALWIDTPIPCYTTIPAYAAKGDPVKFSTNGYGLIIPEEALAPEDIVAAVGSQVIIYAWDEDEQSWRLTYAGEDYSVGRIRVLNPGKAYLAYKLEQLSTLFPTSESRYPDNTIITVILSLTPATALYAIISGFKKEGKAAVRRIILAVLLLAPLMVSMTASALSAQVISTPENEIYINDENPAELKFAGLVQDADQTAVILELELPDDIADVASIELTVNGISQDYVAKSIKGKLVLIADNISPPNGEIELSVVLDVAENADTINVKWKFILQAFKGINVAPPIEESGTTNIIIERSLLDSLLENVGGPVTLAALAGGLIVGLSLSILVLRRGKG